MIKTRTDNRGRITMYFSGIKGGPIVSGNSLEEVSAKFKNALEYAITAKLLFDYGKAPI